MTLGESELQIIKNYAGMVEKLTPDDEPDLLFLDDAKRTIALCEVKTPCMIKRKVFNTQLKKFALGCERENATFYLCVPAQSLGAVLVIIAETKLFEKLIEKKLFKLFAFHGRPDSPKITVEEAKL